MWKAILAIATGSVIGGLLRWGLGVKLNDIAPSVSAEVVLLLQQGRMALAATAIGAHVAGVASYTWLKAA